VDKHWGGTCIQRRRDKHLVRPATMPRARAAETGQKRILIISFLGGRRRFNTPLRAKSSPIRRTITTPHGAVLLSQRDPALKHTAAVLVAPRAT